MSGTGKSADASGQRAHDSDDEFHDAPMPGDEVLEVVEPHEDEDAGELDSAAPAAAETAAASRAESAPSHGGAAAATGRRASGNVPFRSPRDGPFYTSFRLDRKTRYLVVADVDGRWSLLNSAIRRFGADFVISCGNFGFYDEKSIEKLSDREVRSRVTQAHIPPAERARLLNLPAPELRAAMTQRAMLSDLPLFAVRKGAKGTEGAAGAASEPSSEPPSSGAQSQGQSQSSGKRGAAKDASGVPRTFHVPVYTVWGDREDLRVIEAFRDGTYSVGNLHVLDHTHTFRPAPGIRLVGIGGDFAYHKLFDNGDGDSSVAGAGGRLWVTMLQLGELMDTVAREATPTQRDVATEASEDTKILVTHASPSREPLVSLLAALLKADFSVSASTSTGHVLSYSDVSIGDHAEADRRQSNARAEVLALWNQVKDTIAKVCDANQMRLFVLALRLTEPCPREALKRLWNVCTSRIDSGHAVLCVDKRGTVGIETFSEGRDLHRKHNEQRGGDFGRDRQSARAPAQPHADQPLRYETVVLRNLPYTATEADIRGFLKGCQVKSVSIGGKRPGEPRGTAIVDFENHDSLNKGLKLSGSSLGGRAITIEPHKHEGRLWRPSDGTVRKGEEARDSRDTRDNRDSRDARDSRDSRDARAQPTGSQRSSASGPVRKAPEPCRYYRQGNCRMGENCPNSHAR